MMNLEISELKSADVVNSMSADFLSSKYTLDELLNLGVDDKLKIILQYLPESETKIKLSNLTDKQKEFFNKFNFKVIDKKEDLVSLSLTEKHCVLTYLGRINAGECIILTCLFEDKIVTIEITKGFNCNQAMFAYNKPCSYIKTLLNIYLKEYKKINNIEESNDLPF